VVKRIAAIVFGRESLTRVLHELGRGLMVKYVAGRLPMVGHLQLLLFSQEAYVVGGQAFRVPHLLKKWTLDV
jgi:hypothetical protein